MKVGILFLLLQFLISDIYSQVISSTKKDANGQPVITLDVSSKTIPIDQEVITPDVIVINNANITFPSKKPITRTTTKKEIKTLPTSDLDDLYTTECHTKKQYATLTTSLNSSTETGTLSVPIYSLEPKTYEICVKSKKTCKYLVSDALMEVASYIPIACPSQYIDGQEITAVADPNQNDIYIPEEEYNYYSLDGVDHEEYFIIDKVLYCYNKHYEVKWTNPSVRACYTTLDPVEITATPTVSSKTIPNDQPIITTTQNATNGKTLKAYPSNEPTPEVNTIPTKKITTKTVPKTITKTIPVYRLFDTNSSQRITTTTIPVDSSSSSTSDEYFTECDTLKSYTTVTTTLNSPTETDALNVPIYTLVPKTYELCIKEKKSCEADNSEAFMEKVSYFQINCPLQYIDGENIIAVSDPYESDLHFYDEFNNDSSMGVDHKEYYILDKVLYCFEKEYRKINVYSGRKLCTTTLDPVEITPTPEVSSNTISVDQPIITTTKNTANGKTLKFYPETTTTSNVTLPPKKITTKTITVYRPFNSTPSKKITTKTVPIYRPFDPTPSKKITTTTVPVPVHSFYSSIPECTTECEDLGRYSYPA